MNTYQKTAILHQTLKEMPEKFTSFQFTKAAYANGHPDNRNNGFASFLKPYADKAEGQSKTWVKRKREGHQASIEEYKAKMTLQQAIEIVNKHPHYKVLRLTQKWEEVDNE